MKKTIALLTTVLSVALFSGAAAADTPDTIAVIDAYFDKSKLAGNFSEICVSDSGCSDVPTVADGETSLTHGTIMAQIIAKNNPGAKVILIKAGSVVGTKLYQANAREISNAFLAVPNSVSVVSISIRNNNGTLNSCRPGTKSPGSAVPNISTEISRTQSAINSLVGSGVGVIAAAGNLPEKNNTAIDYPACLPNVTAVAKASGDGSVRSQGILNPELDIKVYPSVGLIGNLNTTSGITAAVAAKWNTIKSTIISNSKQFVKLNVIN